MDKTPFHALREESGLSLKEFSDMFRIPYRSVQNWDNGERTPPEYVLHMVEYILRDKGLIK